MTETTRPIQPAPVVKLTRPQLEALRTLDAGAFAITMWGGKVWGSMPKGVRSLITLDALYKRGLLKVGYRGSRVLYSITDAGRSLLAQTEGAR